MTIAGRIEDTMQSHIAALREKVNALELIRREADTALAEAQAELAAAEGNEARATYYRLYATAQKSGTHEAHEAFMAYHQKYEAARESPATGSEG